MKKIFLALGVAASFNLSAQFTITSSMAPVAGDVEASVKTLTTGLTTPTSGTNQFWNYTGAVIDATASPQSSTYTAVSAAPNASLFPGATIASTSDYVNYSMAKYTTGIWENLGDAAPTLTDCIVYTDPMSYLTFPFSYGSSHNDTHAYATPNETVTGSSNTIADGTGTLAIPGFTFTNVLKVAMSFTQTIFDGSMTTTFKAKMNAFFNASSKFPLMSVMNYTFSVPGFSMTAIEGSINGAFVVTNLNEQNQIDNVSLYPNPAAGQVSLRNGANSACTAEIFNSIGELVATTEIKEVSVSSVDISALKPGIYFVHLKNKEARAIKKLIIE